MQINYCFTDRKNYINQISFLREKMGKTFKYCQIFFLTISLTAFTASKEKNTKGHVDFTHPNLEYATCNRQVRPSLSTCSVEKFTTEKQLLQKLF